MNKIKIFNDPVYGFITVPDNILMKIIDHPYFQRLRRIKQLGMTHYVYPGALHTRFHHALGALHLMQQAILSLRLKGVEINHKEELAVQIAILLHDIGHGPFSHALEFVLIDLHHEEISGMYFQSLNKQFDGALDLAIEIFYGRYHKPFLHQLISGQLDVDRMDYLNRDSFFTGVSEGVIGYDRLIKMMYVHDNQLVIEEKGIYSIEKFLVARRLMYWQVYLHKTVLAAELMLIQAIRRAKYLFEQKRENEMPFAARAIFHEIIQTGKLFLDNQVEFLEKFSTWDDNDITFALKSCVNSTDKVLRLFAKGLLDRKLFRLQWHQEPIEFDQENELLTSVANFFELDVVDANFLVIKGLEQNTMYARGEDEIMLINKENQTIPLGNITQDIINTNITTQYYLCYPKF